MSKVIWALTGENLSSGVSEQQRCRPAQSDQRLVFRFLESTISRLAANEISIFQLISVPEETGLSLALLQTPKDRFYGIEAHMSKVIIRLVHAIAIQSLRSRINRLATYIISIF